MKKSKPKPKPKQEPAAQAPAPDLDQEIDKLMNRASQLIGLRMMQEMARTPSKPTAVPPEMLESAEERAKYMLRDLLKWISQHPTPYPDSRSHNYVDMGILVTQINNLALKYRFELAQ